MKGPGRPMRPDTTVLLRRVRAGQPAGHGTRDGHLTSNCPDVRLGARSAEPPAVGRDVPFPAFGQGPSAAIAQWSTLDHRRRPLVKFPGPWSPTTLPGKTIDGDQSKTAQNHRNGHRRRATRCTWRVRAVCYAQRPPRTLPTPVPRPLQQGVNHSRQTLHPRRVTAFSAWTNRFTLTGYPSRTRRRPYQHGDVSGSPSLPIQCIEIW